MSVRPIPNDPSVPMVQAMLDVAGEEWWLTTAGDDETAAVETFKADGSGWQRMIAVTWPTRLNNQDIERTLPLLIDPADAVGLAEVLLHTAAWLEAAETLDQGRSE